MSSTYLDILQGAKAVIGGLGLTGILADQIRVRKRPVYLAEQDTLPLIVVSPTQEGIELLTFGSQGIFLFGAMVTIVQESALRWEDLDFLLEARQKIRRALHKTSMTGVSAVMDCDYDPSPAYDAAALNAGFDVSTMGFTFKAQEARSE